MMANNQTSLNNQLLLKPETLWERILKQNEYALECGALQPIPTESEFIEDEGINFVVRILVNIIRKEEAQKQQEQKNAVSDPAFNPFLPYEENLFVCDISPTHLCLLNKYNVVDYHLLVITRAFEEQENWLNLADFQAFCACLAQVDGLGFYNGGKLAGSSQRHKHLQLLPFPLISDGIGLPINPAIATAQFQGEIGTVSSFPFTHAIAFLDPSQMESPLEAAQIVLDRYDKLLKAVGLPKEGERQSGAYNLLITREWMFLVRRSQESFQSIGVNALGFAGGLFVKNIEQMEILKKYGPMQILKNVALSRTF